MRFVSEKERNGVGESLAVTSRSGSLPPCQKREGEREVRHKEGLQCPPLCGTSFMPREEGRKEEGERKAVHCQYDPAKRWAEKNGGGGKIEEEATTKRAARNLLSYREKKREEVKLMPELLLLSKRGKRGRMRSKTRAFSSRILLFKVEKGGKEGGGKPNTGVHIAC